MHVPFEGLGCIEQWIIDNNHSVTFTKFYENYSLPTVENIDWLIVMGGPMGVYDEVAFPWLIEEKAFIQKAIEQRKTVIGICLGSQLIAEVLGAKVYPNKQKEIGWFDIEKTSACEKLDIIQTQERKFQVFHWHGDTFDLPKGSTQLFRSAVCENQAFIYNGNVLGLQFHFEVTNYSLAEMVKHGQDELIKNASIQSASQILAQNGLIESNNKMMFRCLQFMVNKTNNA